MRRGQALRSSSGMLLKSLVERMRPICSSEQMVLGEAMEASLRERSSFEVKR